VASVGYNRARQLRGHSIEDVDVRLVFTNLGVFDWKGANHGLRLLALHPGVTVQDVIDNTGFAVEIPANVPVTADPTPEQIAILNALDPKGFRNFALG
jgi:glutaconate CoA-transferase subunit B